MMTSKEINHLIVENRVETGKISDGYHTFNELYNDRFYLFIALCKMFSQATEAFSTKVSWRSKLHADGSMYPGWFIMGIGREEGEQISYHLPIDMWDLCEGIDILENAPSWDGHTNKDVWERVLNL